MAVKATKVCSPLHYRGGVHRSHGGLQGNAVDKEVLGGIGSGMLTLPNLCDNQSAICLAKNSAFHARSKHIDVRYHWIRDTVNSGEVEFKDVRTYKNCADMLTKVVTKSQLEMCRQLAGLTRVIHNLKADTPSRMYCTHGLGHSIPAQCEGVMKFE